MFGPARSPTKTPYRSPVKGLALEIEAAPLPPTITDLCYHAQVVENQTSLVCGDDVNPDCSGVIKGTFNAARRVQWAFFGLKSRLSYKNFPVQIRTTDGVFVATVSWACVPSAWPDSSNPYAFFIETDVVRWDYLLRDTQGQDCNFRVPQIGLCTELWQCSAADFTSPGFGELVSASIQVASWGIQSITAPDLIEVGFNGLWSGDHIIIKNTPGAINDRAIVEVVGSNATQVRVDASANLQAQGAGGTIELVVAGWNSCADYTAVNLPASDVYPAQLFAGAGDAFNDADTAFIRLQGAGIYNGDYQTIFRSTDQVELVGQNWISRVSSGNWLNKILQVNAPGHTVGSGVIFGRIRGTTNYDGDYNFEFVDVDTLIIRDEWFVGNETGEIQWEEVFGQGTGLEPGFFGPIAITVTGTTDYDGTWNVTGLEDLGDAFFYGGDFDALWGVGIQAGTWSEVGGQGRSGSLTIIPFYGPDPISSFEPQRQGAVELIDSDVMRVSVVASGAVLSGAARLWSDADPVEYFVFEREIKAVTDSYIEVVGRFTLTDTGRLTLRGPY